MEKTDTTTLVDVERIIELWADRAMFIEKLSMNDNCAFAQAQRMQARILRQCIYEINSAKQQNETNLRS